MNAKQSEPYRPTQQTVILLYTLANLGHSISSYGMLATFSTSPADLDDYLTLMAEQAIEIQRLIQEFKQTPEVKP